MGPKRSRAVLSEQDEAIICAFRQKTFLALDDCFIALKEQIPQLTHATLHRCLRRFGLNRLPQGKPIQEKKASKKYEIGYFHIHICQAHTADE